MKVMQPRSPLFKDMLYIQSTISGLERKGGNKRLSSNELFLLISLCKLLLDRRSLENQIFQRHLELVRDEMETLPRDTRPRSSYVWSGDQKPHLERITCLTFEQKCLIVRSYTKEYEREHHHLEKKQEAMVEEYRASIAALKLAAEEVARNVAIFNRTVNKYLRNDYTAADAAKFVRIHKIYINRLNVLEQTLRVENANIRRSCRKMRFFAKQREYFEIPREKNDLEYVTICCHKAQSTLMDKDKEFARMKMFANKVTRELGQYRTELSNEMETSVKLERDMEHKTALIRLVKNSIQTYSQLLREETCNTKHIEAILAKYKVPSTSQYIKNLEEMTTLVRKNATEIRKKSLAELNLQRHKQLWSQIKLGRASIPSHLEICSKSRRRHDSHKDISHLVRLR